MRTALLKKVNGSFHVGRHKTSGYLKMDSDCVLYRATGFSNFPYLLSGVRLKSNQKVIGYFYKLHVTIAQVCMSFHASDY